MLWLQAVGLGKIITPAHISITYHTQMVKRLLSLAFVLMIVKISENPRLPPADCPCLLREKKRVGEPPNFLKRSLKQVILHVRF